MIVLRNYLREAYLPNGNQVLMKYGSDGQLLRRRFYDASAEIWTTTNYLQSGAETIGDFDGSWNLQAYYVPGLMLDHIEIMHKGGADYYFVRDHLGSVRLVLDANADVVEQYEYSDYGELTIKDAYGTPLTQSAIGNRITYTGREWDNQINAYYYRERYYSPISMIFLSSSVYSKDIEESYAYAGNSPIGLKDPFGLMKTENCCDPKKLKKGEKDPDQIPENKYFEKIVDSLITNTKIKNSIKLRMKKTTITCKKDNEAPCNQNQLLFAQGAVGFFGGGNSVTLFKGNSVTWCGGNMTNQNCGPEDRAKILIHEFAHNCGLPSEGIYGKWDIGGKMSDIAPGEWGRSGVPGTTTGGDILCTGK